MLTYKHIFDYASVFLILAPKVMLIMPNLDPRRGSGSKQQKECGFMRDPARKHCKETTCRIGTYEISNTHRVHETIILLVHKRHKS